MIYVTQLGVHSKLATVFQSVGVVPVVRRWIQLYQCQVRGNVRMFRLDRPPLLFSATVFETLSLLYLYPLD